MLLASGRLAPFFIYCYISFVLVFFSVFILFTVCGLFCLDDWARPIFGVTSNFKSLSREEREQRDYQNMSKKRRLRYRVGICYYGKLLPRQLTSRVPPISGTQILVPTEKSSYKRWSVNFTEGTPL